MSVDGLVELAQVASGFAALAAVWLAVATARAGRRVPLTDSYMGAWQSILDVLAEATERRSEPPPEERADQLMRQFRAADHRLSVIEATLRVRLYDRDLRHQLNNLLHDVLFDDPEVREDRGLAVGLGDFPRSDWATCTDDEWLRVLNSVPFTAMMGSDVTSPPGRPDDADGLLRWYFPAVLAALDHRDSVLAPSAPPQMQLAFLLGAYQNAYVLPWMRDAAREALLGKLGWRGYRALWRRQLRARRFERRFEPGPSDLFSPTSRRPARYQ